MLQLGLFSHFPTPQAPFPGANLRNSSQIITISSPWIPLSYFLSTSSPYLICESSFPGFWKIDIPWSSHARLSAHTVCFPWSIKPNLTASSSSYFHSNDSKNISSYLIVLLDIAIWVLHRLKLNLPQNSSSCSLSLFFPISFFSTQHHYRSVCQAGILGLKHLFHVPLPWIANHQILLTLPLSTRICLLVPWPPILPVSQYSTTVFCQ